MAQDVIDLSKLTDSGRVGAFHVRLLLWSFLLVLIDGYDIGTISFALPDIIKEWNVPPHDAGPLLSGGIFGMLIGAAAFGSFGDRYGRRAALVVASLLFGLLTLAGAFATSLTGLTWLRLLAGVGIGGIIPNVVALNSESAPARVRGTLAMISIALVPIGGAIAGLISAFLVPIYGWRVLLYVGGAAPLLIGLLAWLFMPESLKFMAIRRPGSRELVTALRAAYPSAAIPMDARIVVRDEVSQAVATPGKLFADGLATLTILMWVTFALSLLGFYFLSSWTPTLLVTAAGLPPQVGALAGMMMLIGGAVGPLLLCRWLDRRRFLAVAILFLCAVPVVGSIGRVGMSSKPMVLAAAFLAGFLALSIQTGLNVSGALVYPTYLRSTGSGWQLGVGRLGSIAGPLMGAMFVSMPVGQLYMWAAIPWGVGGITCLVLHLLTSRTAASSAMSDPHLSLG